jgi:hypothetical protein
MLFFAWHDICRSLYKLTAFFKKTANINSKKKTYQFINDVNGVSHVPKTANIFFQ